jgi:hypothetical protein
MKKHIVLISVILLLSANKGCTPGCNKEARPTFLLSPVFREYIIFPRGSYWIYKTSDNTQTDSVYLDFEDRFITNEIHGYNSEFVKQGFYSSAFRPGFLGVADATDTTGNIKSTYYESVRVTEGIEDKVFFNGKVGEKFDLNGLLGVQYESLYDTLRVRNKLYTQVRVYTILQQLTNSQCRKAYYAKNVGVIRKELFNGQVWELERYFINR